MSRKSPPWCPPAAKGKRKEGLLRFLMRQLPRVSRVGTKSRPSRHNPAFKLAQKHQVDTKFRITLLFSMRVSVCRLEGGIFDGCWFNPAGQWLKPVFCKVSRRGNALFVHSRRIPGV